MANLTRRDWRNWYSDAQYRKQRAAQLRQEPLCAMCLAEDPPRITLATVTHHVEPHKGDINAFRCVPLQSLCKPHHDGLQRLGNPRRPFIRGSRADGSPLDPNHPWYRLK